jgi:hypothetical protein
VLHGSTLLTVQVPSTAVPIILPADAPAWAQALATGLCSRMEGLENSVEGLENRMEGLENRMESLENRMEGLENSVEVLTHSSGPRRLLALINNGSASRPESPLVRVPHPRMGELPGGIYPNTHKGKNSETCGRPIL